MKSTCLETVLTWSRHQPDRRIDFNGFCVTSERGNALVDPLPLDEPDLAHLADLGGAAWIVVTNFDHLRATAALRERLGARAYGPACDRARFGDAAAAIDAWYESEADLPEGLRERVSVRTIRGGKSPGEVALWLKSERALLFGDVVRSHVSGRLRLLPDEKLADKAAVVRDLAALRELPIEAVLLGDGDSLYRDGAAAYAQLVAELMA